MTAPLSWFVEPDAWAPGPAERGVLLVGGYQGYANFGDVLQLRGAIAWHRTVTGLDPIPVISATPVTRGFLPELRATFGVRQVAVWSEKPFDAAGAGLVPLEHAPRVEFMHAFGGECLMARWHDVFLRLFEDVHRRFGVRRYTLSGQQADAAAVPGLTEHFARCPPIVVGTRDRESAANVEAAGAPAVHGFDDALEELDALIAATPRRAPADALVHLNTSHYAARAGDGEPLSAELGRLAGELRRRSGDPDVVLLSAFDDPRALEVADTRATVAALADRFPFPDVDVVDLARLALASDGERGDLALPGPAPLAFTCSYHVSLLCTLLGVPTYLHADHPAYRQKRAGLGLPATTLAELLADPAVPSLAAARRARTDWLGRLAGVYAA